MSIALAGLSELLERSTAEDVNIIDASMRDTTSYPIVMRAKNLIKAAYGYEVLDLTEDNKGPTSDWFPDGSGIFGSEFEQEHHIALVRHTSYNRDLTL